MIIVDVIQKAAYVMAQSVAALAEIEAMKVDNRVEMDLRNNYPMHNDESFLMIIEKYGLDAEKLKALFDLKGQ